MLRSWALLLALCIAPAAASAREPTTRFKFAVMCDTQWKSTDAANNPNTVAVGIIDQLNRQFIQQGVDFVIQVGDLTDNGSIAGLDTRAAAAKPLYDAGIGFFPLRGNHEGSKAAALEFLKVFPQTQGGGIPKAARSFSSPSAALQGLTYAFDYGNARFVLLDQFTRADGTGSSANTAMLDQVPWIAQTLAGKPQGGHAFVFSHKGLITENHTDTLFGANPAQNPDAQNAFMAALAQNGVRYLFGGHDHIHNRALVVSPDGKSSVQDVTTASNSYKFYVPLATPNDVTYDAPTRETELAQELFTIGYYLVTVDGPQVTVEYWASPNGCNGDCDLTVTPTLEFAKRETFGYGAGGQEWVVPQGASYAGLADAHLGTGVSFLGGTNLSTGKDAAGRALSQLVTTSWTESPKALSSVVTLRGLEKALGSERTSPYVLSMTVNASGASVDPADVQAGLYGIASPSVAGEWVNAVDLNHDGKKAFVLGAWTAEYPLGTHGVDLASRTVWAVVDHGGAFALARFARQPGEPAVRY
jgi:3',5'-cyclic AMP phosphodiesterase CpdA